jgi:hypothetical protein
MHVNAPRLFYLLPLLPTAAKAMIFVGLRGQMEAVKIQKGLFAP